MELTPKTEVLTARQIFFKATKLALIMVAVMLLVTGLIFGLIHLLRSP